LFIKSEDALLSEFFVSDAAHDSSATQIDIETITALANTATCKLELFVALNTTT